MPVYSSQFYNSAALLGGGKIRRKKSKRSRGGYSAADMIHNAIPVKKGSPEAKAKMAALRAMRRRKRRR